MENFIDELNLELLLRAIDEQFDLSELYPGQELVITTTKNVITLVKVKPNVTEEQRATLEDKIKQASEIGIDLTYSTREPRNVDENQKIDETEHLDEKNELEEKNAKLAGRVDNLGKSGIRIQSNIRTYLNPKFIKQITENSDVFNKSLFNSTDIYTDVLSTEKKLDELTKNFEALQKENAKTNEMLQKLEDITVEKLREFN